MAIKPKYEIKSLFETGDLVTASSMSDLIDASYNPTIVAGNNITISTINTPSGSEITINSTGGGGGGGQMTPAEVRAAVEAANNSNVFTDANLAKLNGIEAGADVTDVTNVTTALNSISVTELSDVSDTSGTITFSSILVSTSIKGPSANSLSLENIGTIAGGTGDPSIRFENDYDVYLGDVDEVDTATRIHIDAGNEQIELATAGEVYLQGTVIVQNNTLRGSGANTLDIQNVGTLVGGTGDPTIRFENDYDVYLGDADEADTATRIHVDAGNEQINLQTSGEVVVSTTMWGPGTTNSLDIKSLRRLQHSRSGQATILFGSKMGIVTLGDADDVDTGTKIEIDQGSEIITITATDSTTIQGHLIATSAQIDFTNLPTSDPGVTGRLYRDASGFVKVSL